MVMRCKIEGCEKQSIKGGVCTRHGKNPNAAPTTSTSKPSTLPLSKDTIAEYGSGPSPPPSQSNHPNSSSFSSPTKNPNSFIVSFPNISPDKTKTTSQKRKRGKEHDNAGPSSSKPKKEIKKEEKEIKIKKEIKIIKEIIEEEEIKIKKEIIEDKTKENLINNEREIPVLKLRKFNSNELPWQLQWDED